MAAEEETSVVLRAPAKLNLGLRIVGLRNDGYHELESLFVPISLYDEVTIAASTKTTVTYATPNGQELHFENDTVSRALKVLNKAKIQVPPTSITITKRIPSGAGLGGGSSDAATAFKFLFERFAPSQEDTLSMVGLGLQIGADVPFFLGRGSALVFGIGDRLKLVKIEPFAVLVITPPFGVLTKDAYGWFDQQSSLTRRDADATTNMIQGAGPYPRELKLREILEMMKNDLEKPVETRHPEIGILKKALRKWGALGSLMTGTGSSVYGVFRSLSDATSAREKLQQEFPSSYAFFVCETLV